QTVVGRAARVKRASSFATLPVHETGSRKHVNVMKVLLKLHREGIFQDVRQQRVIAILPGLDKLLHHTVESGQSLRDPLLLVGQQDRNAPKKITIPLQALDQLANQIQSVSVATLLKKLCGCDSAGPQLRQILPGGLHGGREQFCTCQGLDLNPGRRRQIYGTVVLPVVQFDTVHGNRFDKTVLQLGQILHMLDEVADGANNPLISVYVKAIEEYLQAQFHPSQAVAFFLGLARDSPSTRGVPAAESRQSLVISIDRSYSPL